MSEWIKQEQVIAEYLRDNLRLDISDEYMESTDGRTYSSVRISLILNNNEISSVSFTKQD